MTIQKQNLVTEPPALGLIGLGRMGASMAARLREQGQLCVVWDIAPEARRRAEEMGLDVAATLDELVQKLPSPRAVWLMVPAGLTPQVAEQVAALLVSGDILIDGGNSHYRLAVDRAQLLAERGVMHVDVGTSGGVHGRARGYCLMVGGEAKAVRALEPYFQALAPGVDAAARLAQHETIDSSEKGYLHCGPAGAGHFVKMVHNAIEYGMMSAYAEGFNLLMRAGIGNEQAEPDAETAPLFDAKYYRYDFDVARIAELWRRGSVIPSWLLDLTAQALAGDPALAGHSENVSDSGEGRWAVQAAVDVGAPNHVLSAALFDRFASRGQGSFAARVQSAMRWGFGGHGKKDV